jgi:hypothetical protein
MSGYCLECGNVRCICAEIEEATKKATEWQPIETAPTDGTVVLGWSKRHGVVIGPVANYKRREMPLPYIAGYKWCQPSHWQPLPSPPNQKTGIGACGKGGEE